MSAAPRLLLGLLLGILGCRGGKDPADSARWPDTAAGGHGPMAEGIFAPLGQPVPFATDAQRAIFDEGIALSGHRFTPAEGLGPAFNLVSCAGCHEKPAVGGSAGRYRNFFLTAEITEDGAYIPGESFGKAGGVMRLYTTGAGLPPRPPVPATTNLFAQRNPIPFFGVGLIAELDQGDILAGADPQDADGDGISGRPNYDRGFVGRFGRKAQTVSIEGFIRGPLNNHLGITSDPLTEDQRAALPVDSSGGAAPDADSLGARWAAPLQPWAQASAPDAPLADNDAVPDPELSGGDLFALVSFAMLTAPMAFAPESTELDDGRVIFDELGCGDCHRPRLMGPRGPLPVYSDLLLHDMGPALADGVRQGEADGAEFRTQPLWGVAAVGPYLHDGRAHSLDEAIRWHGGEGERSGRDYEALPADEQALLIGFLRSLGGAEHESLGLQAPGARLPGVGEAGGPTTALHGAELEDFAAGRLLFDREFGASEGLGAPRFNGDSCRACHFDPVPGGAGPLDVNVMRHGILSSDGRYIPPVVGSVLHRTTSLPGDGLRAQPEATLFEPRQTPTLLGLGLIDGIAEATIAAQADPHDADGDGISGEVSLVDGGRVGRFGWKAQVPSVAEFVRDALSVELGLTLEARAGLSFGQLEDNDGVADPELGPELELQLQRYLLRLGPPPRQRSDDPAAVSRGAATFEALGCAACHSPALEGASGPVPLYSDLLLHDILPEGTVGIEEGSAGGRELRTPPLWGLAHSAPYLHDGAAATLTAAIAGHHGEGAGARAAFDAATPATQADLLRFLETL
jgi:CxxC motif-containing protein (DUF1111 family)